MSNIDFGYIANKYAYYYHNERESKNSVNREFWRAKAAGFNAALEIITGCRVYAITNRCDNRSIEYSVHIGDYRASVVFDR